MAWPAAGASRTMQVGQRSARSSCLTLPSTRMSRMPGTAVATMSSAPLDTSRFESGSAVVLEVLEQGVVGGEGAGPDLGRPGRRSAVGQHRPRRRRAARRPNSAARPDLPSTSTISGDRPCARPRPGERGGDGRFAHAALARHDDDPGCSEELRWIHSRAPHRRLRSEAFALRRLPTARCRCSSLVGRAARALAGARPARPAPAGGRAQAGDDAGRVSVVKVSGLLDPVLADFVERVHRRRRGRRASWRRAPAQQHRLGGRRRPPGRAGRAHPRRRRCRSPCGSGPAGRGPPAAPPSSPPPPSRSGIAPGSRLGKTGDPVVAPSLLQPGVPGRPRPARGRHGRRRAGRRARAAPSRRPPSSATSSSSLDGVADQGGQADDGKPQRRAAALDPGVLARCRSGPAVPHRGQPAGGLPAVRDRPGPHRVRAVHRRRRRGRPGGRRLLRARCYGLAVLPARPVGRRPCSCWPSFGFAVDVQTGVPRVWTGVGAVALVVGSFAPLRRPALSWITLLVGIVGVLAVHDRRHAGHGPHPLLHADHRAGVDDRRGGRGRHRRRRPTASCGCAAPCGGPAPTGPRPSRCRRPSGWSRSTACCSRSSPSRAAPRTTARALRRRRRRRRADGACSSTASRCDRRRTPLDPRRRSLTWSDGSRWRDLRRAREGSPFALAKVGSCARSDRPYVRVSPKGGFR